MDFSSPVDITPKIYNKPNIFTPIDNPGLDFRTQVLKKSYDCHNHVTEGEGAPQQ